MFLQKDSNSTTERVGSKFPVIVARTRDSRATSNLKTISVLIQNSRPRWVGSVGQPSEREKETWRLSSLRYRQTHPFRQQRGRRLHGVGEQTRRQESRLGQCNKSNKRRRRKSSLVASSKRGKTTRCNHAVARTRQKQCPPGVGPHVLPAAPPLSALALPLHPHRLGHRAAIITRDYRVPGCPRTVQTATTATAAADTEPDAPYLTPPGAATTLLEAQVNRHLAAAQGKAD